MGKSTRPRPSKDNLDVSSLAGEFGLKKGESVSNTPQTAPQSIQDTTQSLANEFGLKKKEDLPSGGLSSVIGSPTPSPLQENKDISTAEPTVKTKKVLSDQVGKIVADNYQDLDVQSKKSNIDLKTIVNGAKNGGVESVAILRNLVYKNYDKKIADAETPQTSDMFTSHGFGMPIKSVTQPSNAQQINLKKQKEEALNLFNSYGTMAITGQHKKVHGGNIDKLDFVSMGKDYQKYFGEGEETRKQELAQKSNTPLAKIAKQNINFNYASMGVNGAIHDAESDHQELLDRSKKDKTLLPEVEKSKSQLLKLYNKRDGLMNEYPEVREQVVAEILGNEISEMHGGFNSYVSKDDIQKAALRVIKKYNGKVPDYFAEDVGSIYAKTSMWNGSPVAVQGAKGSLDRSLSSMGHFFKRIATAGTFSQFMGDDPDEAAYKLAYDHSAFMKGTAKSGGAPEVMVVDNDGKTYIPKSNEENFHKLNVNNAMRAIGGSIPTVAAFVMTEGASGVIGESLVVGAEFSAIGSGAAILSRSKAIGKTAAFFVTGFDGNHDRASELIKGEGVLSDAKRNITATAMTLMDMLAFEVVGTNIGDVVKGSIKKSVAKDLVAHIEEKGIESVTKPSSLVDFLKNSYSSRLIKALGKDGAKMGVATALQTAFKDMTAKAIDPNAKVADLTEYIDAVTEGAITGVALGLPGHVANSESRMLSSMNRDALYEAARNSDKFIKKYNDQVESGQITRQQANEVIKIVNTAKAEYDNENNFKNKDGRPLSESKAKKLIAEKFIQRATELIEDKAERNRLREQSQKRIDEIKNSDDWVDVNDTPIIKEMNITSAEGTGGHKVDKFEDIDPSEDYHIDGAEKKISGTDLIEEINNKSKEYKHEEIESAPSEKTGNKETQGPETKTETSEGSVLVDFKGKDNNFLANKEPDFFTPEQREKYNDLMKKEETQGQASEMVSERKKEFRITPEKKEIADKDIEEAYKKAEHYVVDEDARKSIGEVISGMNNAEYINEGELSKAADHLYDLLDKYGDNESFTNLIEPLINKIEGYEFATKTQTRTVTEKVPTQVAHEAKRREIKPALETSIGSEATVSSISDGSSTKGKLSIKDGNYVITEPDGTEHIIGEKKITDKGLKLAGIDKMENPVILDNDGNVKSITFETPDGSLLQIDDADKALDLAIQISANDAGDVTPKKFDTVYEEIQKEIKEEVPIRDISSPQKTENEKDSEKSRQESSSQKNGEEGRKKDAEGNDVVPDKTEGAPENDASSTKKEENEKNEVQQSSETEGTPAKEPDVVITETKEAAVSETDPLEVSLQRDALMKSVRDEFFKPENGSNSTSDQTVMTGAINTLSTEAAAAGKSVLKQLSDKINYWYADMFDPKTGNRKLDQNGRPVQKVLTDEEYAMLGIHSLKLAKNIKESKLDANSDMDGVTLQGLLDQQEQLQRMTAAITEAAGRGFRFIQQVYKFGDQGDYNIHIKIAERLVGTDIPLDPEAFIEFKKTLPSSQQKTAQIAHDALIALKGKYDEIEKRRSAIDGKTDVLNNEEVQRQIKKAVEEAVKNAKKESSDKGEGFTDKSGKIKNGAAEKISEALHKLADNIEKNNLLGGNLPEGTQTAGLSGGKNFSKSVADGIRRIAEKIKSFGGKLPDLIEDEVKLLVEEGFDERSAKVAIKDQLRLAGFDPEAVNALPRREELIKKITDLSKNENSSRLSKEAVKKGLLRDLSKEVAERGTEVDKVPDEVVSLLKDRGIDIDRKEFNDAYLRTGEYKMEKSSDLDEGVKKVNKELRESEQLFHDISKLEDQIESVNEDGTINKTTTPAEQKEVNKKIQEKEGELKRAMIKKGIKFERGSKESQAAKNGVLDAHNDAVKEFGKKIIDWLNSDKFGTSKVEGLKDFLRGLEKKLTQKVDATHLKTHIKEASLKVEKAINEFNREYFKLENRADKSREEVLNELNKLQRDLKSNDSKTSEQIALERYKKRMLGERDEYTRKKNAGDFDNTKSQVEFKKDNEAYGLFIIKEKAKLDFARAMDAASDAKAKQSVMGKIYLFAKGVRSVTGRMVVSGLGNIQAKLAFSAVTRRVTPLSRLLAKGYSKVLGVEKSTVQESSNPKAMWRGYTETIKFSREKQAQERLKKSYEDFDKALDNLNDAKDKYSKLLSEDKVKEANEFKLKELTAAQNDYEVAAMNDAVNFMYHKMHANPWTGRLYIFKTGLNKQEELTGMFSKRETIKDVWHGAEGVVDYSEGDASESFNKRLSKGGSKLKKIVRAGLFYANMTTRSHSVWKDIPSRQATVEGYMKRLEHAQTVLGEDISDYSIKNRIWHEAVSIDGQAAKFQDKNMAVDFVRNLQSAPGKFIMKIGGNDYEFTAKTVDEVSYMTTQVLKVPMNIARAKIFQYQLGVFTGIGDLLVQMSRAKKEGLSFVEHMKTLDPKYTDRIVSALSKGTVGMAASILSAALTASGSMVMGGHYPDKKKTVELADGSVVELDYGDIVLFGHKMPHWAAVGWGHTLLGYTSEMGSFITEEILKNEEQGETALTAWMDALLEAGKVTVSEIPFILPYQRERDPNNPGKTVMAFQNPFHSFGYNGAIKSIQAGIDELKSPEDRVQYAKQYQMTAVEGFAFRSGLLFMVPTAEEAAERKAREQVEKDERAAEYHEKHQE